MATVEQEYAQASSLLNAPGLTQHDRLQRSATLDPGVISFAGGLPDPASFPKRDLSEAFVSVLGDPACGGLQYGWPEGLPALRQYVVSSLGRRGVKVLEEQVLITSGAQQALVLALNACTSAGDCVATDDVTYPGALDAIKNSGARAVPLHEAARAYYVMPRVSNPRGMSMSHTERARLLQRARHEQALIIEDDAYGDIAFTPAVEPPLIASAPERVFHVGTFSKTLCPGLRVGWLVSPLRLAKPVLDAKQSQDLQTNGLAQALLSAYLKTGRFDRHLSRVQQRYRRRAQRLIAALRRNLTAFRFTAPHGGFSVWLESDLRLDEEAVYEEALQRGVTFDAARPFRLNGGGGPFALRLCYSSVPQQEIETGVKRLAAAFAKVAGAAAT